MKSLTTPKYLDANIALELYISEAIIKWYENECIEEIYLNDSIYRVNHLDFIYELEDKLLIIDNNNIRRHGMINSIKGGLDDPIPFRLSGGWSDSGFRSICLLYKNKYVLSFSTDSHKICVKKATDIIYDNTTYLDMFKELENTFNKAVGYC